MQLDYRDEFRRRVGRAEIDSTQRQTRANIEGAPRGVFLHWDNALDDAGQLRRCIACGNPDLFRDRAFPQVTVFVVVLAFAGAIISALGLATPPILVAMIVVFVLDVSIFLFSKQRLTCYRCRSTYGRLPIADYHRGWDRSIAERYPTPDLPPDLPPDTPTPVATSPETAPTGR